VRLVAPSVHRERPARRFYACALILVALAVTPLLALGTGDGGGSKRAEAARFRAIKALRLAFVGDVTLRGRVARTARERYDDLFAGVRFEISSADLAMARVDAAPSAARALARAGLDVAVVSGDDSARGPVPRILHAGGLRVALLSLSATARAARAREAVVRARSRADIVTVALQHGAKGGALEPGHLTVRRLASWGVDVVWSSSGVSRARFLAPGAGGRPAVVASGLGNLISGSKSRGVLLEVLAGADGVVAFRIGRTTAEATGAAFAGWKAPRSDAVALDDGWWTLARPVRPAPVEHPRSLSEFEAEKGEVTAAALGDVKGDGGRQLVVSFRRPYRSTPINELVPKRKLVDADGLTAHIGLYRPRGLRPLWVAGTVLRPVRRLAVCDGTLAVSYSALDGSSIVGAGAWRWSGFGFTQQTDLAGAGTPACADVDGDGRLDPLILERSS
jgi:hypothetical protein